MDTRTIQNVFSVLMQLAKDFWAAEVERKIWGISGVRLKLIEMAIVTYNVRFLQVLVLKLAFA
jgi:hypothetical protein